MGISTGRCEKPIGDFIDVMPCDRQAVQGKVVNKNKKHITISYFMSLIEILCRDVQSTDRFSHASLLVQMHKRNTTVRVMGEIISDVAVRPKCYLFLCE